MKKSCRNLVGYFIFLFTITALCSGCSIFDIRRQSKQIGNAGIIQGIVKNSAKQEGALIVVLYKFENNVYSLANAIQAGRDGEYRFWAGPGTYFITAFLDSNNDGEFQETETWNYYGNPDSITLIESQSVTLDAFSVTDKPPIIPSSIKVENHLGPAATNFGRVVRLDDPGHVEIAIFSRFASPKLNLAPSSVFDPVPPFSIETTP